MDAIKLAKTKTQFDLNLEAIDQPLDLLANKLRSAVHDLNQSFNALWSLTDPEIEEILNYFGIQTVITVFTAHYNTGTSLNAILEARGIADPRAVVEKPRDFEVNPETGYITLVPIGGWPVPEPPPWVDPRSILGDPEYDPRFDPAAPEYDLAYVEANPYPVAPPADPAPEDPPVEPTPPVEP